MSFLMISMGVEINLLEFDQYVSEIWRRPWGSSVLQYDFVESYVSTSPVVVRSSYIETKTQWRYLI